MIKVSVVVPVYNEENTILDILRSIRSERIEGFEIETIVIDDGSVDRTPQILAEHPDLYTKLIKMPRNSGKGAAVKAGISNATGEYVLFQDADLEYSPKDYPRILKPIALFSADAVIGSRMSGSEYTRVFYFWHKVGNRLITLLFNILNNATFTDIYSCYLIYRRSLFDADDLISRGWAQHAEILSRVVARTNNIYEVPISYRGRTYDEGKKIKAYHVISVLAMIVRRAIARKLSPN